MKINFFKFGVVIWGAKRGLMIGFPLDYWDGMLDDYDKKMERFDK